MHSEKSRRIKKQPISNKQQNQEHKIRSVTFSPKNPFIGDQGGRQFMLQFLKEGFMNLSGLDSNTDCSQTTQPETENS